MTLIHDFQGDSVPDDLDDEGLLVLGLSISKDLAFLVVYHEKFNQF